jgi:hypothetical protein
MSARRWFLPLGRFSAISHAIAPDFQSLCGLWNLARPGVIEEHDLPPQDAPRIRCPICRGEISKMEAGASNVSGEKKTPERAPSGPVVGASPLTPPATP